MAAHLRRAGWTLSPTDIHSRCVAAAVCLAAAVAAAGCARPDLASEPAPKAVVVDRVWSGAPVIVISIDTLRSDHLPAYGYAGVETPNIDGLRADGVLFVRAYSHSPLTLPSHTSLLTGLLPAGHGVRNNIGYTFDGSSHPTIPSLLSAEGYATGAAVSAYILRAGTGLGAIFDHYEDGFLGRGESAGEPLERPGQATVRAAARWIEARSESSFFFLLHLYEPHTPYDPPEPFRARYEVAYDGEIAAADAAVGEFLDMLQRLGVYDRAVVVLLSDHGEGLGDHGEEEHGLFLYREAIQVPLIVKLPGSHRRGTSVAEPVQLIDILPTVTDVVGVHSPPGLTGRPLFGDPAEGAAPRTIVAETWAPRLHYGWSELWSLVEGPMHYIEAPRPELYDLTADPAERQNLAVSRDDVATRMADGLRPFVRALEDPRAIHPADAERLRALGYLGALAVQRPGPLPDPKDRLGVLRMLNEATALAAAGKVDEAVSRYQRIIAENPGFVATRMQLARIAQENGRWELAVATYEEIVKVAPYQTQTCAAALATIHLRRGNIDEAEAWACRCIDAGGAFGHVILGRIRLSQGKLEEAQSEARLAMGDPVQNVVGAVLLAEVLAASGRLQEGLQVVSRIEQDLARQHRGPVERLHMVHGDLLARLDRFDEAERHFLREISMFPRNLSAYTNLTVLYDVTGRRAEARATLERMVAANPMPSSMMLAARTSAELGDTGAAEHWRQRIGAGAAVNPVRPGGR